MKRNNYKKVLKVKISVFYTILSKQQNINK